jgi:hypothetical protein
MRRLTFASKMCKISPLRLAPGRRDNFADRRRAPGRPGEPLHRLTAIVIIISGGGGIIDTAVAAHSGPINHSAARDRLASRQRRPRTARQQRRRRRTQTKGRAKHPRATRRIWPDWSDLADPANRLPNSSSRRFCFAKLAADGAPLRAESGGSTRLRPPSVVEMS